VDAYLSWTKLFKHSAIEFNFTFMNHPNKGFQYLQREKNSRKIFPRTKEGKPITEEFTLAMAKLR